MHYNTLQRSPVVPILGGITALGGAVYYFSKKESPKQTTAQAKRDEGLSGAGIGGNATTGGHELSSANPKQNKTTGTTAKLEDLPAGGVGGGVGAGGMNSRSIEMTAKKGNEPNPSGGSTGFLANVLNPGGANATGTGRAPQDMKATSSDRSLPTKKSPEKNVMQHATQEYYSNESRSDIAPDQSRKEKGK